MRNLILILVLVLVLVACGKVDDSTVATNSTDSTDSTDYTDSTDGFSPTDESDTTDGTDTTDAIDGSDATDGTDTTDAIDGSDAMDGTEITDSTDGTDNSDSTDVAEVVDATDASDSTDATDSTDSSDATDSTEGTTEPECHVDSDCPPSYASFHWCGDDGNVYGSKRQCLSGICQVQAPYVSEYCSYGCIPVVKSGVCAPYDCGDGNPCTADSPDNDGGCNHVSLICDDGDWGTDDICDPETGSCVSTELPVCVPSFYTQTHVTLTNKSALPQTIKYQCSSGINNPFPPKVTQTIAAGDTIVFEDVTGCWFEIDGTAWEYLSGDDKVMVANLIFRAMNGCDQAVPLLLTESGEDVVVAFDAQPPQ